MEKTVVSSIVQYVRANGGKAIKLHGNPYQEAGTPDLIGSVPVGIGKWRGARVGFIHFMVEVKEDAEVSRLQQYRLDEWWQQGFVTGVVRSVTDFEELIERGIACEHY